MMTKQNDTACTDGRAVGRGGWRNAALQEAHFTAASAAPCCLPWRFQFKPRTPHVGGTMCSARASQVKERGVISRVAMPDWARYRPIGIPPEPE